MLDSIRTEQDEVWSKADREDLQRTTDLARRTLGVSAAMLRSPAPGGENIRHFSGEAPPSLATDAGGDPQGETGDLSTARLDAPLIVAGWPSLGILSAVAAEPRDWTQTDRDTLRGLADSLAELLVARRCAADRQLPGDASADATAAEPELSAQTVAGPLGIIIGHAESIKAAHASDMVHQHADAIIDFAEDLRRLCKPPAGISAPADASASETATAQDGDFAPDTEKAGQPARILLADDLDLNRKLISDMLSIEGHVVHSVADGAAAVKAAEESDYDLILMDMIMPGMDGIAAARAIRALPAPAGQVPIVALTAHSLHEQLDNCLHAGMNALLTKPMSLDALTDAVSTWTRPARKAA